MGRACSGNAHGNISLSAFLTRGGVGSGGVVSELPFLCRDSEVERPTLKFFTSQSDFGREESEARIAGKESIGKWPGL